MLVEFMGYENNEEKNISAVINPMKAKPFTKIDKSVTTYIVEAKAFLNSLTEKERKGRRGQMLNNHIELIEQLHINSEKRVYADNCIRVLNDEVNELDKIGCTKYSRQYQIVYDFGHILDILLSEIFGLGITRIRETLTEKATNYGLTYEELSRAILEQNPKIIENLGMEIFFDIHTRIDDYLILIANNLEKEIIKDLFGNSIDVEEYHMSEEEKFCVIFYTTILRYLNSMINQVIADFYLKFKKEHDVLITSKSLTNIVINSRENLTEEIELQLQFNNTVIKPIVSFKGKHYLKIGL